MIGHNEVVQLTSWHILCVQESEKSGYAGPNYRSGKLKVRLENHDTNELISFVYSIQAGSPITRFTMRAFLLQMQ